MFINFFKRKRDIKEITKDELKFFLNNFNEVILLDVRSHQEYEEGHLQGAINIPIYELEKIVKNKIKNFDAVIIAYCSAGIRSKKAVKILKKLGYKNLYNIKDGINI